MKGCFIILNYKDGNITQEAISYLQKINNIRNSIIVVFDNGSNNGCYELLKANYRDTENVIIEGSKENLGFSGGNNAAYNVAKRYHSSYDFVVAMNSDVMIHQKDFINRIEIHVSKNKYALLGPDVYNSRLKTHQSPIFCSIPDAERVSELIDIYKERLENIDKHAETMRKLDDKVSKAAHIPYWIIELYRELRRVPNNLEYKKKKENAVISGSCVIYLKSYLDRETLLFEPDTFLYGEEILLLTKCVSKGYKALYDPSLRIEHRESVSTRADISSYEELVERESIRMIHALTIVKERLLDNPWKN